MNDTHTEMRARRSVWVLLAPLFFLQGVWAAPDQAALLERMHRVIAQTSLDAPGTKPWHLKLTIQLNENDGAAAEKGTVEEWWASPKQYRRSYNFPSYAGTMLMNGEERYVSDGPGSQPYLADYLLQQVIHPMPSAAEIDLAHLDLRKETFGKNDFDCVMLDQPIKNVAYPPFGLFPTYCLDRDKDELRVSSEFGSQVVVMNRKGVFRGTEVALDLGLNESGKVAASAHVDSLQGRETPYTESQDMTGLKAVSPPTAKVEAGVIAVQILKKVAPVYPEAAKRRHASGTVLMRAIIGKEGHIHFLQPKSFPDPDLVIAAIAAVRQWTYKPYLLNGVPTEVDTTVTVNFNLGPG